MPTIQPWLWFDTEAEEAVAFYVSVFPRSCVLRTDRYGPDVPGRGGQVMSILFSLDGQTFGAINGSADFPFTQAVSFLIDCGDQDEVDHYWSRLTEGGKEVQCGWLIDRYGLSWQVVPRRLDELLADPDPARAARAMAAMMSMVKLDIAALEAAADGATDPAGV
ncbi:VOC family protein [Georgenia wangjunii]|uniref:VOC family protein n=1 Tax=Georgenia wangjunii TaxID=3117730 RepID=UPI002F268E63